MKLLKPISLATYVISLSLLTGGVVCLAYALIAYQNLKAAAALPFALGAPDYRHVSWPVAAGILSFLMASICIAFSRKGHSETRGN